MKKRILSCFLILAMLIPGCAQGSTEETSAVPVETTASPATEEFTEPAETKDPTAVDNLPQDLNFNGKTFTMFTRQLSSFHYEINKAETIGEQLNDALYQRGRDVEDRLGLVIEETISPNNDVTAAKTAIFAGDDTYKMMTIRCVHAVEWASNDLAYSWDDVEYIDLTKDYWIDSINQNLTFAGKKFTGAGAYNLSSMDFTHVMLFNKKMITDLELESPYELVLNGKWTFDKLQQLGTAAYSDLNGDGAMTIEADRFGMLIGAKHTSPCFWIAAGQESIRKDENDVPQFTMATDDSFLEVLTDIYELMWDGGFWYQTTTASYTDEMIANFSMGNSLFMYSTFYYIKQYRDMDADFGILPYPKYTEEQKQYYSRIEGCDLPLIPSCLSQEEANMAGAFLEAMSSYSLEHTVPVYYEVYLKTKMARDSDSADMLDLIFANRVFDLGDTIWCPNVRDAFIFSMFQANNRNFTSMMKKSSNAVQKAIDGILVGFTD